MTTVENDVAELPALATKKLVAAWAGTTTRNIELQVAAGSFPGPVRLGHSPRWRRSDLLAWLERQSSDAPGRIDA